MRAGLILLPLIPAALMVASDGGASQMPIAEPVDFVAACPQTGAGYFHIPGSDVCLRIGGEVFVRASAAHGEDIGLTSGRDVAGRPTVDYRSISVGDEDKGLFVRSELTLQTSTPTEVGPLLTSITVRETTPGITELREAWINWGGLSAGRRSSFFDVGSGYTETDGVSSNRITNLLAYTHWLLPNFAVTFSLEDGIFRRVEEGEWAQYAGQTAPDAVLALYYERAPAWLNFAVAGHQVRDVRVSGTDIGWAAVMGVGTRLQYHDQTSGRILATAAAAQGAIDYLGVPANAADFILDEGGEVNLTDGYSALVSYEHFWRPDLRTAATASLYRTSTETPSLEWNSEGFWLTVGAEYLPVRTIRFGLDLTYYRDSVWAGGSPKVHAPALVGYGYIRGFF